MTKDCVIFDLDGTLADCQHRRHWIDSKPKNWNAFNKGCVKDTPNKHVLQFYHMVRKSEVKIIICSGRDSKYEVDTIEWLINNGIKYDQLFMRKEKDYRDDTIVKKEMLDKILDMGYNVLFSVDDRDKVVKMWRDNNIPCFQCNYGDF